MNENAKNLKSMFIFLPALAMMLGWGLRGHIGGGPFGAMIPGAMVTLCIAMLLNLPARVTAILVVFGVVGVGLGGEMTYGQTLGFLRNNETVWWGTIGTSLKGGVWGLFGGIVIAIGFIHKQLSRKTIVTGLLLALVGMLLGFKLINEPMLLYFSDPAKPRSESWAALLLGALTLFIWLKIKCRSADFRLVKDFAILGLLSGALGFGLGGFWMVMGSNMPDGIVFGAWWKAMEFTFGFIFGAGLGIAAWINKTRIISTLKNLPDEKTEIKPPYSALLIALVVGLLIYWIIPSSLEPFVYDATGTEGFGIKILQSIAGLIINYAFYGLIMIFIALKYPHAAWQIGITLTFCHTVIDMGRDHIVKVVTTSPDLINVIFILITTIIVALLVATYQKREMQVKNMFLLLIWSTVIVSTAKIGFYPAKMELTGLSFSKIVFGLYVVDLFFLICAIVLTVFIRKHYKTSVE